MGNQQSGGADQQQQQQNDGIDRSKYYDGPNKIQLSYSLLTISYTKILVRPRLLIQPNLLDLILS